MITATSRFAILAAACLALSPLTGKAEVPVSKPVASILLF